MKKNFPRQDQSENHSPKKGLRVFARLFRFGTLLSAVMVVMSLISGLGTHLINKLGGNHGQEGVRADSKLPYEPPAYRLFESIFVSDAKATLMLANIPIGM